MVGERLDEFPCLHYGWVELVVLSNCLGFVVNGFGGK